MQISSAQLKLIEDLLPIQRGNVTLSNLQVFNAILYVAEHGCKWRGLPKKYGNWHSIHTRANRWAKNGVFDRVFAALQERDMNAAMPAASVPRSHVDNRPPQFLVSGQCKGIGGQRFRHRHEIPRGSAASREMRPPSAASGATIKPRHLSDTSGVNLVRLASYPTDCENWTVNCLTLLLVIGADNGSYIHL
jgi:transposase